MDESIVDGARCQTPRGYPRGRIFTTEYTEFHGGLRY